MHRVLAADLPATPVEPAANKPQDWNGGHSTNPEEPAVPKSSLTPSLQANYHGCQRIVRSQRPSGGDILKVKGRAVRHPDTRLHRPTVSPRGEQRSVGPPNVNLDDLGILCIPTKGCRSMDGVARHRYGIRVGRKGRPGGGARRVDRGDASVPYEGIGVGRGQIQDIDARGRRGVVNRNLHSRISNDQVLPKEISRSSRKQYYPICIPDNNVLLDDVAGSGGTAGRANAKVIAWS
jgi:hypothetical protein